MSTVRRLDEVSIFNGKLSFLIPHEWIEVESDDEGTYLYQAPDARSGWFRVSLVTAKAADPSERLQTLFSESENVTQNEATGNLIRRSEKEVVEDGDRLHIYYWFVGGIVPPDIACEAVFSYTVVAEDVSETATQSEVQFLDQVLSKARFNTADEIRPA